MWKYLYSCIKPNNSSANTYGKKAIHVQWMWEDISSVITPEETSANTYLRNNIQLQYMWEVFSSLIRAENSSPNTYRKKTYTFSEREKRLSSIKSNKSSEGTHMTNVLSPAGNVPWVLVYKEAYIDITEYPHRRYTLYTHSAYNEFFSKLSTLMSLQWLQTRRKLPEHQMKPPALNNLTRRENIWIPRSNDIPTSNTKHKAAMNAIAY